MSGEQFRPIDAPYLDQWRKRLERAIKDRIIAKLQVLDEHDLMFGYPKPVKVKPKKKGKKKVRK